jgi:DNA modification methylase
MSGIKIEYVNPAILKPSEYNPRKASQAQVEQLTESIKRFGLVDPIIANSAPTRKNIVIGGHFRLRIAQDLKHKTVPVVYVNIPDIKQEQELNIRLNKNTGEFDYDLLANFDESLLKDIGFDSKELDVIFQVDQKPEDDEVPEVKKTNIKRGDLFQLGEHRLLCGDSLLKADFDKLMNGKKTPLIFTDPPYGVSYGDKNKFLNTIAPANRIQENIVNDTMTEDETNKFWKSYFTLAKNYLAKIHSYYIFSPQIQGMMMMMMMMMMMSGMPYRHVLIWVKNNHVLGRTDYNYKHEPMLYGWTKEGTHKFYGGGSQITSVWTFDKPHQSKLHPTMKPVELIENAILNSSKRNDIVLDSFLGSGSTLIACQKTNRICYGMEIDPHYTQVSINRWQDFTNQKAKKL